MKKKKNKHPSPMEYRVKYRVNGSKEENIAYYSVFHSSEAVEFLAHTYRRGHILGDSLTIYKVEEHNRYSQKWQDRTEKALDHATVPELNIIGAEATLSMEKNGCSK
jgi:hypothetical protein